MKDDNPQLNPGLEPPPPPSIESEAAESIDPDENIVENPTPGLTGLGFDRQQNAIDRQQNAIERANEQNKHAQLTLADMSYFDRDGIRVLSLFGGIETALVSLKQLGIKIALYVSVEIDKDAQNMTRANHADLEEQLVIISDICDISQETLASFGGFHLVIGGSPCQDFSHQGNLNGGERAGLTGSNGSLFFEYNRVLHHVTVINARQTPAFPKPAFIYENVSGMSVSTKAEMTKWLGVFPCQLNAELFSPAARPRDFYTNLFVEHLPPTDNPSKIPFLQQVLTFPAKALRPKAKTIITSNGGEVFATGRSNEYYQKNKRWIKPFNRVFRSRFDESLGFRNFSLNECEKVMGLPEGYTSVVSSGRSTDINRCWQLLGNSFSVPCIIFLLQKLTSNFPLIYAPRYPFSITLSPNIDECGNDATINSAKSWRPGLDSLPGGGGKFRTNPINNSVSKEDYQGGDGPNLQTSAPESYNLGRRSSAERMSAELKLARKKLSQLEARERKRILSQRSLLSQLQDTCDMNNYMATQEQEVLPVAPVTNIVSPEKKKPTKGKVSSPKGKAPGKASMTTVKMSMNKREITQLEKLAKHIAECGIKDKQTLKGWKCARVPRKGNIGAAKTFDFYYFSAEPEIKKFRSFAEVVRYLKT